MTALGGLHPRQRLSPPRPKSFWLDRRQDTLGMGKLFEKMRELTDIPPR
ncbi:MAG: hypothetical protein ACXW4G_08985 [Candidatus Deferrimicrobiaceae bacterium]